MLTSFADFVADSKVHDTVLMSMVVSSFLAALRRIKDATKWWQLGFNFLYDWATGFWSMRNAQQRPITTQQVESHTDGSTKDVTMTTSSTVDPTPPVTIPASPTK